MRGDELRTENPTNRRIVPFAVGSVIFLLMTAAYVLLDRRVYDSILVGWGVNPFTFAFVDTDTVLSAVRCVRQGADVFVTNPCDVLGRVFDYSPLWLRLAYLPVTTAWIAPVGFFVDIAFLLSLLLLPPTRGRSELNILLLGLLSSGVIFAMDRGNNDLVLFVLAAVAAFLATRSSAVRVAGYAAALLAGLLKYYPMTLMLIATRERPRRFVAITIASAVIVLLFVVTMGHDLARALRLVPTGSWFGDMFGSSTLPGGLGTLLGWAPTTSTALHVALSLGALAAGCWIGLRDSTGGAIARLTEEERTFLMAGVLLILSCFFTAQNIGYRVIHLLLTLPALTALWRLDKNPLWPFATVASLMLLWSEFWRSLLRHSTDLALPRGAGWILRETLWWGLVNVLIALTVALLNRSVIARIIFHGSPAGRGLRDT